MIRKPFFSIIIPVYKNIAYLKRLLDSLEAQTFQDFEVVITDDSPDRLIEDWIFENYHFEKIVYHRNPVSLGTPENWNEGLRRAGGTWLKIMHDDDWFATETALEKCYLFIKNKPAAKFIFVAYSNFFFDSNRLEEMYSPFLRRKLLRYSPHILYARNIVGPPSVTFVHSSVATFYDKRMKWLVDIDYYIGLLRGNSFHYINEPLVNVGVGKEQVTTSCHSVPEVEVPEGLLLLSKMAGSPWRNVLYFDAWWRLVRNLEIRTIEEFMRYSDSVDVPRFIRKIIQTQQHLPIHRLKNGYFSKVMMFRCWLLSWFS